MVSRRRTLQEDINLRTLRLLHANPRLSQRDLASRVGISVGAAHYCLAALAKKGLIKLGNFSASRNKRNYIYLLTPEGLTTKSALTLSFLRRKLAEHEALKAEIEALKAEVGSDGIGMQYLRASANPYSDLTSKPTKNLSQKVPL